MVALVVVVVAVVLVVLLLRVDVVLLVNVVLLLGVVLVLVRFAAPRTSSPQSNPSIIVSRLTVECCFCCCWRGTVVTC